MGEVIDREMLKAIIDDFVDRCFEDPMIGFIFQRADRSRIKTFEYQHAAAHLGYDVKYRGRDLKAAHSFHRIVIGQFNRRLMLLQNTLQDHGVSLDIQNKWLSYHRTLQKEIVSQMEKMT